MTIESIVRGINRELVPLFEERLRAALADQDREWLVDQVVRLTLDAHALERGRPADRRRGEGARPARAPRAGLGDGLRHDPARGVHRASTRRDAGVPRRRGAPAAGGAREGHRAAGVRRPHRLGRGAAHARQGRAVRAALRRRVDGLRPRPRRTQELLTLALPRSKAGALDFMRASTELAAAGTWQDPESVSNDERADNVLLEVQFGEVADELVGHGIVLALTADQQPRGERAGPLRPDDQHRGDVADPVIHRSDPWLAPRRIQPGATEAERRRDGHAALGGQAGPAGPGRACRTARRVERRSGSLPGRSGVVATARTVGPRVPGLDAGAGPT